MHLRTWVPFLGFWIVSISQVLRYFVRRYQQLSWVVGCLVLATNGLKFVWCLDSFHTMDAFHTRSWNLGFWAIQITVCFRLLIRVLTGMDLIWLLYHKKKTFIFNFFYLRYRFITEDEHLNKFIHCFPGIKMLIITDNMDLCFTVFSCYT